MEKEIINLCRCGEMENEMDRYADREDLGRLCSLSGNGSGDKELGRIGLDRKSAKMI